MTRRPRVVLDPGHGSGPKAAWLGRGYDSGAVWGHVTEAEANLDACFTLKHLLTQHDIDVILTHTGQQGKKPDLAWRIRLAHELKADALISVHFDMKFTPSRHLSGIYYAPGAASRQFAVDLLDAMPQGHRSWLRPSSSSRFNGLYIDAFTDLKPSVMLELDSIEYAPALGAPGKAGRLKMLTPVADRIARLMHARV